jgi:hypothetical protein
MHGGPQSRSKDLWPLDRRRALEQTMVKDVLYAAAEQGEVSNTGAGVMMPGEHANGAVETLRRAVVAGAQLPTFWFHWQRLVEFLRFSNPVRFASGADMRRHAGGKVALSRG